MRMHTPPGMVAVIPDYPMEHVTESGLWTPPQRHLSRLGEDQSEMATMFEEGDMRIVSGRVAAPCQREYKSSVKIGGGIFEHVSRAPEEGDTIFFSWGEWGAAERNGNVHPIHIDVTHQDGRVTREPWLIGFVSLLGTHLIVKPGGKMTPLGPHILCEPLPQSGYSMAAFNGVAKKVGIARFIPEGWEGINVGDIIVADHNGVLGAPMPHPMRTHIKVHAARVACVNPEGWEVPADIEAAWREAGAMATMERDMRIKTDVWYDEYQISQYNEQVKEDMWKRATRRMKP